MRYRQANLEEAALLAALRLEMLREHTPLSAELQAEILGNTRRFLSEGMEHGDVVCWVAESGGCLAGMGCVNFFILPPNDWCPNGKTAYVGNVYVKPEYRRQGVASETLTRLVACAKARGCQRVLLNATDMGKPLYLRHGFEDSPTAMALYPFGHAAP